MNQAAGLPLSELVSAAAGFLLPLAEGQESLTDDPIVKDIALYEPGIINDYQGQLVLVTARVPDRFALGQLLEETGTAVTLVLPPDATSDLALAGGRHPILLRRSPWAGWTEVFRMLTRALGAGSARNSDVQLGSLTDLAAWIARLTGSSVTIEDLASRVLAYDVVGREVDAVRSQTILSRAVPPWRLERLMSSGFLPAVWRSDEVVVREAEGDDPARMVVAVRAAGETLGTIWAAFGPETDRRKLRSVLLEARAAAAALLVREVHRDEYARRIHQSALADLLRGEVAPGVPTSLLGLDRDDRHSVVTVGPDSRNGLDVAFHVQAACPGSVAVPVDGDLMVIVPVQGTSKGEGELAAAIRRHLIRVVHGPGVVVAVGPVVDSPTQLAESAAVSREVLRAIALKRGAVRDEARPRVITAEQVDDAVNLIRASDRLRPMSEALALPLHSLQVQDPELVATLREVVRFPGNLAAAARELGIHGNSLRYRLARINEASGIDLRDPESRLRTALALLIQDSATGKGESTS